MRDSGIELVGSVPWGTHFCQFYRTGRDLLELLVPYFKAGLEANEFCMWVTSEPLGVAEATAALRKAVGDLDRRIARGQIELLDYSQWYTLGGVFDADRVLGGWVAKLADARRKGFKGLRLTGNTFWLEKRDWASFRDYEAKVDSIIGSYPMLAVCTYCLDRCGASEIADVISNHEFALIQREGRWEMIQSARRQTIEAALRQSLGNYRQLFEAMSEGFALHEIICDERGKPRDYRFLEVNPAFERLTGLRREAVVGKTIRQVLPSTEPLWVERYGQVALTGQPDHFEGFSAELGRHY